MNGRRKEGTRTVREGRRRKGTGCKGRRKERRKYLKVIYIRKKKDA